jgi:hypothetical protein
MLMNSSVVRSIVKMNPASGAPSSRSANRRIGDASPVIAAS